MIAVLKSYGTKINRKYSIRIESDSQFCDRKSIILFYMSIIAVINVSSIFLDLALTLEPSERVKYLNYN